MPADSAGAERLAWCAALEARWHGEIPITASMGIAIDTFDGDTLVVRAALAQNVNVHGSVFAGSQFSLASLCGWGLIYLRLLQRGASGSIVFADGHLRCLAPARDDIVATAVWNESAEQALSRLAHEGRCRIVLSVEVAAAGRAVATLSGDYALRGAPDQ